jgi:hypothetical protein
MKQRNNQRIDPSKMKIVIHCADKANAESCLPARTLDRLLTTDKLRMTLSAMIEPPPVGEPLGNCHNISESLMMELWEAEVSEGWWLVTGRVQGDSFPEHSWLEYKDWVIDCSTRGRNFMPVMRVFEKALFEKLCPMHFDEIERISDQETAKRFKKSVT